jgi:DMSO/TMAO reductase YedYZ molybdopterin-dependent catalytic subunit
VSESTIASPKPVLVWRHSIVVRVTHWLNGNGQYYESIDLVDAYHAQTILAYGMNGKDLSVGHGAPLRLRVERQLGYKHAKYVMRVELVDSFARIGRGHGGFWPDRGYEWYAGV